MKRSILTAGTVVLAAACVQTLATSRGMAEPRSRRPVAPNAEIGRDEPPPYAAPWDPPEGALAGSVVKPGGAAAPNAVVRMRRSSCDDVDHTTTADASGRFAFPGVSRSDVCDLAAEYPGFAEARYGGARVGATSLSLVLVPLSALMEGRLLDSSSGPVACRWIAFVAADGGANVQTMTDLDGAFRTTEARDVEFEAFPLVARADGRLVRGASAGRCRGGQTKIELRAAK